MAPASASIRRARPLLGTFVEIAVAGAAPEAMEAAVEAAFDAASAVHGLMSFHEAGSDVSRLNREAAAHPVRVHAWTFEVLGAAMGLHRRSEGAFDICVAPALQRLGLLPATSDPGTPCPRDGRPPSPPSSGGEGRGEGGVRQGQTPGTRDDRIQLLRGNQVRFADPSVKIDLGGIAKGYAVDCAVDALQRHGIPDGLVNAGGDLRAFGPRSHMIDIRDPRRPERTLLRVALGNGALASSAGRFDPMQSRDALASAVIDPVTGMPAQAVAGATVCAPRCIIADALTKVVMNAGEDAGTVLEHYGADALFVTSHGAAHMTANWKNEVHLAA
jgi:FAD:protein FMN transferase